MEATVHAKDVSKYITIISGEQCVMMDSMMLQQELFVALLVLGMCIIPLSYIFHNALILFFFGMHRVIIKEENANTIGLYFKKYVTKTFNVRHETVTRALTCMSCIIVHYFCIAKIVNYTP